MESLKLGNLIRTGSNEILSCTLTHVDIENKALEFLDIYFRDAVEKNCGIIFYRYKHQIYYPISMEFRLIDNNILHLIEELKISSFEELSLFLESSFKREEGRGVSFFPVVIDFNHEPKFSYKLTNFIFEDESKVIGFHYE